ncbi:peptide chain release factor aRF-1 [Candidatus Marsarchaeota archaeon]|nr:peptide chain release factor aRF-1 [Candidatus Marsarchaeota archaeon]
MKDEYKVKKELKKLAAVKGTGTELISIYVPPGMPISDEIAKLRDEHSQSGNIKSKSTRQNVQTAIEKIMQYLRLYKSVPENGLAVFCGNISNIQAKPDIELFSMEPPAPIKANIYRCDSEFMLEPIMALLEAKEQYVLLVLDGRDATIALLKGTSVIIEKKIRSFAHAKVRKGGQSAARYERAISESISDYYKRVGDSVNAVFEKYGFKINGLIIGGPGPAKDNFVRAKTLNYQVKVLGVFDTGYTDESMGINELLERAKELLKEQAAVQERRIMERFLSEVARSGLATSTYDNVKNALMNNNVSRLIISEDADLVAVTYRCTTCNAEFTVVETGNVRQTRHNEGGALQVIKERDAVEELVETADNMGVDIVFISSQSQYGKELLLGFGGIAAMLKYRA